METKGEFQRRRDKLLTDTAKMIEEAQAHLISHGEAVDLSSWVIIFKIKNHFLP
jgi:hypothetical protein